MAQTHHTGIPRLQWTGNYPPCVPSAHISADINPFCAGESITFTPSFYCIDTAVNTVIWAVNGVMVSSSPDPFTSNTLVNGDRVYLAFTLTTGQTYFSNIMVMVEKSEAECVPPVTEISYGLLYNNFAATDARLICADGWGVPSKDNWETLINYLGGIPGSGGKLKEIGTTFWDIPNTGAANEVGFTGRGSGRRSNLGVFGFIKQYAFYWNTTPNGVSVSYVGSLAYNSANSDLYTSSPNMFGFSIRAFREATAEELLLPDGLISAIYIGNDGKVYRCCKIGTKIWTADNLAETRFRNGDYIHGYEGGSYQDISNAAWAALVTDGVCAYNDDINNI